MLAMFNAPMRVAARFIADSPFIWLLALASLAVACSTPSSIAGTASRVASAPLEWASLPTPGAEDEIVEVAVRSHDSIIDKGFVSLDERVLRAEIIAIATMKSAKAYAKPYFVDKHMPALEFTFDAHQYLKGEGGDSLTVLLPLEYEFYDAENEAVERAKEWIGEDRWWDDRPSLIFLQAATTHLGEVAAKVPAYGPERYEFIPNGIDSAASYAMAIERRITDTFSIRSQRNRVWLPSSAPANAALNLDSANAGGVRFLLGEPLDDAFGFSDSRPDAISDEATAKRVSSDISLSALRSRIKAMEDLVSEGGGVEGYAECLEAKMETERRISGRVPGRSAFNIDSGLPAGSVFESAGLSGGNAYRIGKLKGPHGHLFEKIRIDSNDNPTDGYRLQSKIKRPLPRGAYELESYSLHPIYLPCNYELLGQYWTVHVAPPAATIHEAFFDPASVGSGGAVGADASNGVLKPAGFTFGGADVSLDSIRWESQAAEMRLSPHTRLANHHADFIALDGSVALRLDFDDATETGEGETRALSWPVCAQPWQAGDLLMLRISESPSDLSGVSRDADCVSATAVPATATPEADAPTPTATPEMDTPTATPEADTPTPVPSTPAPDTPTPTPTPEGDTPTPTPAPTVAPIPDTPTPTPAG